jgi:hypothetical protein
MRLSSVALVLLIAAACVVSALSAGDVSSGGGAPTAAVPVDEPSAPTPQRPNVTGGLPLQSRGLCVCVAASLHVASPLRCLCVSMLCVAGCRCRCSHHVLCDGLV